MKSSRLHAAAIWAISAWPALNFISANCEQVASHGAPSLLGILVSTLVMGAVGHALQLFAARSGRGGLFVVIWLELICLFFGYTAVRDFSHSVFEALGVRIPSFIGFILVVALVFGVTARFRRVEKLQFAAVTFCLAVAVASAVMLMVAVLRFDARLPVEAVANAAGNGTNDKARGPSVYYIILDAYPGLRGLQATTGFDNSAFIARMAERGFVERSSERSNYLKTSQELGAIFALDYALTEDPRTHGNLRALYPMILESRAPPPLVARLNAAGYAAWHSASPWDDCPRLHFNCLGEIAFVGFDRMTQAYFAPTPFGRPLLFLLGRRHDAITSIVQDLPTLARSVRPVFVFGHHMAPHPPFLFGRDCQPQPARHDSWEKWNPDAKQAFIDAISCVNLQVEQLVDAVLRVDSDALIVLQGDHGSAFTLEWQTPISTWPASSIAERASFLNLIRAPAACTPWLDRPLGQINTARFVIACIERRPPVYLPERTYLSTYAKGPERAVVSRWNE